jgi:hypothetical protein
MITTNRILGVFIKLSKTMYNHAAMLHGYKIAAGYVQPIFD